MASEEHRAAVPETLHGTGLRLGIVSARWNASIVARLEEGAHRAVASLGVRSHHSYTVPGCFEVPLGAQLLANSGDVDAIVCLGVVIRGATTHYELVAGECGRGVQDVQLKTGVPIGFGVLTVENQEQALERSEPTGGHNVGEQAVYAAIEMARLAQQLPSRNS